MTKDYSVTRSPFTGQSGQTRSKKQEESYKELETLMSHIDSTEKVTDQDSLDRLKIAVNGIRISHSKEIRNIDRNSIRNNLSRISQNTRFPGFFGSLFSMNVDKRALSNQVLQLRATIIDDSNE